MAAAQFRGTPWHFLQETVRNNLSNEQLKRKIKSSKKVFMFGHQRMLVQYLHIIYVKYNL